MGANSFKVKNGLLVAEGGIDATGTVQLRSYTTAGILANSANGTLSTSSLGNGLSYSGSTLSVGTQMSITVDSSGLKLNGDVSSPGNNYYYGTDGSGTKGWYVLTSGSGSGTVNSGTQYRLAYYAATGAAVSAASAITGSRALVSDTNGVPTHSSVTDTELSYVSGATSNLQTQITTNKNKALLYAMMF